MWRWELLIIGVLIATVTGVCTGNALFEAFTRTDMDLPRSTVVTGAVIIGGIPFAIGLAMIRAATKRRGREVPPPEREGPPESDHV